MYLQRKQAGKGDNTTKPHVNAVSNTYYDILSFDYDANGHLHIHSVSKSQYKSKIFAHITLSDQKITMQIDSGASCNVLPEKFVPPGLKIQVSNQPLTLYSKASLPVVATCTLQIKNLKNDLCYEIPFVVIKGDYIPLLGSQAAQQMHWLTVEYDNTDEPLTMIAVVPAALFLPKQLHRGLLHLYNQIWAKLHIIQLALQENTS